MIFPEWLYFGIVTTITGGGGAMWMAIDAVRLRRALRDDRSKPSVRDRIFGSTVGIVIGGIGVIGSLRYHGFL